MWELSPEGRQRLQRTLEDLDQHEQPNHAPSLLEEDTEDSQELDRPRNERGGKASFRSGGLDSKRSKDLVQHEQPDHASALLVEGAKYSQELDRPNKERLADEELNESRFKTKSTRRETHATYPKQKTKSHQNDTREEAPDRTPVDTTFTKRLEALGTFKGK